MLKILKSIWSLFRTIVTIILIVLIAVIITQRVSNNQKAIAGFRVFNVITESMVPEYKVGDTILTKTVTPSELKIGDDITYMGNKAPFKGMIITHRVVKIEKQEDGKFIIQTKGLANDIEDPEINESQVYGKVIYKIKSISFINGIIGNLYGMYFAIFIPFGIITFVEFVLSKRDKDNDTDEDEDEDNDENKKDKLKERRKNRRNRRRKRKEREKEK